MSTQWCALPLAVNTGLFDALPVNTTAICCGDSTFFKAPHVIIEKAYLVEQAGLRPIISVYDDGDDVGLFTNQRDEVYELTGAAVSGHASACALSSQ